ncbi:hypothetical protein G9A89_018476 [Geosiphon pyriformis]|nr:hypothetical protein G9A89_018476 [Geosiphon pyriformis]
MPSQRQALTQLILVESHAAMVDTLSFEETKVKWDAIFKDPLLSLTSLREKGVNGNICSQGLRSICWKLYLSYLPSLDTSTWPLTLQKERQHYGDLRQKYITSPNSDSENEGFNDLTVNNPLSLDQANPWQEYFKDTELRKIIRQDVERTFPDIEYFRTNENQTRLLDILFIYCKMNQDVSYRQGMHELLAPILWVLDHESLSVTRGYKIDNSEDAIIKQALDAEFVEHDSFALFSLLMKSAKVYYEYNDEIFNRRPIKRSQGSDIENARLIATAQAEAAKLTPVVMKCNKIHEEYLKTVDPDLYNHLKTLEIEPQLYGIRWIRLLFGREFPLEQVLLLWDGMFAEDPTLRIVDFMCVAMMLLIRDELLESDYAGCLSMLMRYPAVNDVEFLIKQAIFLRDHMSSENGSKIIQQNAIRSGKTIPIPLTNYDRDSRRHSASGGPLEGLAPDGFVHVTKNVLESKSAVAINKAILSAVGEVKKNVLRRSEIPQSRPDSENRKRSSEFPSRYGNSIPNNQIFQSKDGVVDLGSSSPELAKLQEQNNQMATVVSKSIELLEQELFVRSKNRDIPNPNQLENLKYQEESHSSFDDSPSHINSEISALSANEISILHALAGLKHVRDVLDGSTKDFNPSVFYGSSHTTGEEHDHWEVVDDEVSVVSVLSTTGEDEELSSTTTNSKEVNQFKQDKVISIINSQKSTGSGIDVVSKPLSQTTLPSPAPNANHQQSSEGKPLSPIKTLTDSFSTTAINTTININPTFTYSKSPTTLQSIKSTTSPKISRAAALSHSKPKINMEDLFDEVAKGEPQGKLATPKATISSNSKYSWILEGAEDDDNGLFSPKRGGSMNPHSEDLFNQGGSPPKQRASNIIRNSASTPMFSGGNDLSEPIDPLGAKPFLPKSPIAGRERSGSVGSTSSSGTARPKSIVNTGNPSDDPLGVL